ncbi:uncharacterized protein LOC127719850 isoform X1 [Mytilus californianus]|uniref:uncharacterized protein LOC127719850 isoform X1 n=1 Tax=Mytilus californianus TaxID=6549 RepID=UPI0022478F53|nr:uncharacterized protein LOC127719850 isoform X1 [Mytilus californianus]XP_052082137.1 uncharacterized protein LOC127719850 isoform X1 [Mytilus californianus]
MKWWWFSLVLFGLTSQFIVKENVMFQKIKEISTTRSNWLITFVVDLDPFELFLNKIEQDLGKAFLATQKVHTISMFYTPEKKHILATILSLQREVEGLNRTKDYLQSQFNDYQSLYYDETAKFKTKRSLFPIIGKALSFLFGTVSDSDLSKIRRNIKTLAQNQDAIRHIVQDGLTILNTTQTHVSENRHKVNELIESVQDLGNRLQTFATDLEKQIEVMGSYLQAYLHMDMIIGEIKDLMNIAGDYLNHLQLQLNMLSLGHMSPSLISPGNLRVLLTDIKRRLPATLKIPGDEVKDIWNFYKFLTCSTVLDENKIIIIITLPLLDIRDTYEIYKIHNLPVPTTITDKQSDSSNMVAQYELEAEVIAANQEKTKYMLLNTNEIDKCSNPLVNFCEIKSPVYPVNLSKLCIIALFANKENWKTRCTVKVRPNTILPMATYLTDSMWAVTTINEFRITIRCDDNTNMLTDQIINPPTTIINLKRTCTATSDHLTLLPTYQMESTFLTEKTFERFLNTFQVLNTSLWEPFHAALPNFTKLELPRELKAIKQIPMNALIEKLRNLRGIENDFEFPNWGVGLSLGLGAIFIGIAIFLYCKFFRNKSWLAKKKGVSSGSNATNDGYQMVTTQIVGTEVPDSREKIPSAPLLKDNARPKTDATSLLRKMYPELDTSTTS